MFSFGWNGEFQIDGGTPWGANSAPLVEYRWFHGDYLKTMGIRILQGRTLDERDHAGAATVLVNHAMADNFWPGKDPIGKRFGQGKDTSKWYEVVGVLSDVRSLGLARSTPFEFYRSLEESVFDGGSMTVVVRTHGDDPTTIVPTARQIVASIDPSLPLNQIQTLEHVVRESVGQPRLMSALTVLFGALAGLLAMVGVYGVMAYNVRRQRREFGIRIALGADQPRLRKPRGRARTDPGCRRCRDRRLRGVAADRAAEDDAERRQPDGRDGVRRHRWNGAARRGDGVVLPCEVRRTGRSHGGAPRRVARFSSRRSGCVAAPTEHRGHQGHQGTVPVLAFVSSVSLVLIQRRSQWFVL